MLETVMEWWWSTPLPHKTKTLTKQKSLAVLVVSTRQLLVSTIEVYDIDNQNRKVEICGYRAEQCTVLFLF